VPAAIPDICRWLVRARTRGWVRGWVPQVSMPTKNGSEAGEYQSDCTLWDDVSRFTLLIAVHLARTRALGCINICSSLYTWHTHTHAYGYINMDGHYLS